MAMYSEPMYQKEIQRAGAKASMRGNRPKTEALMSRLAEMDLARKLAFGELALSRKRSDLHHAARMDSLSQGKKDLKKRKKALPLNIGIGLGTSLLSGLEGRRRANLIKQQNKQQQQNFDRIVGGIESGSKSESMPMSPLAGKFSGYGY